jgi:hypothetical protein
MSDKAAEKQIAIAAIRQDMAALEEGSPVPPRTSTKP